MTTSRVADLRVAIALSLGAIASVALGISGIVALALIGAFVVFGPGLVLITAERIRALGLVVVAAVSVAAAVVMTQVLLFTGMWSGRRAVLLLAAMTCAVAMVRLARWGRPAGR